MNFLQWCMTVTVTIVKQKTKTPVEWMNNWNRAIHFYKNFLTRAIILLLPAASRLCTSRSSIGCVIWQHAVIWESICEDNSIVTLCPALRTGFFFPVLTCSLLLFFTCLKLFYVQIPSLAFTGQICSKSSSPSFCTWTNYSESFSLPSSLDKRNLRL